MAKADRPLTEDERSEVKDCVAGALQWLGDGIEAESPDQLLERLYETVNAFRDEPAETREAHLSKTALCLGCLWGQSVCDRLGWEWAAVSLEPGSEVYGVVSPSRSHVVFPLHYLQELLSDPERDQTSLLLYNMLKAGSLPPAGPVSTASSGAAVRPKPAQHLTRPAMSVLRVRSSLTRVGQASWGVRRLAT